MKITFLPINKNVDIESKKNLNSIAFDNNINIGNNLCVNGRCGRCKVIISRGNDFKLTESEKKILNEEEINKGVRLACCFIPTEDTCVILLNKNTDDKKEEDVPVQASDIKKAIAIDLGTTTIKSVLVNIEDKTILKEDKVRNPQSGAGADVISRIGYTLQNNNGLRHLQKLIIDEINSIIARLSGNDKIEKIIIVGNTTMINILMGYSVESLGMFPYVGTYIAGESIDASSVGIRTSGNTELLLPPIIAGHVGSDAYACIADIYVNSTGQITTSTKNEIIIDIGTNGEIVLNKQGDMCVCSTAAGPAFDNISGITGSEIIDIIADMLDKNLIDETGLIVNEDIYSKRVSQEDIRNVQLAKAAISAALEVITINAGLKLSDIDTLYVAGEFGRLINIDNAIRIGLLPDIPSERIIQTGNSAINGAVKLLDNISYNSVSNISHIELSSVEGFNDLFIDKMNY